MAKITGVSRPTLYNFLSTRGAEMSLESVPGSIRQRNSEAPASSPTSLEQPAGCGYDATACSENSNRRYLNVVDRLRHVVESRVLGDAVFRPR